MNKVFKYTLIALGLNVISMVLFCIPMFISSPQIDDLGSLILAFALTVISLIIQIITGLIFLANENKKEIGQGMLLSAGIILLIGLSICTR